MMPHRMLVMSLGRALSFPLPSYKDSLMNDNMENKSDANEAFEDDYIEVHEEDVTRSIIDGIPSIEFSDRIQSLVERSLDQTLVVKLLGRRIGYTTLHTKILELWKPQQSIRLMDIENDYFLVTFKLCSDYLKALAEGPWTIFGHCLTVQQWSPDFSTVTPYPTKVMVWIRLPGLPVPLYKKGIIEAIGESIGPMIKLDYQMEWGQRGRFARMAITIDLSKPLVSKIIVKGKIQLIEYESLPMICFQCGKYGHAQEICSSMRNQAANYDMERSAAQLVETCATLIHNQEPASDDPFGPWMIAALRPRRITRSLTNPIKNAPFSVQTSRFIPIHATEPDEVVETCPLSLHWPISTPLWRAISTAWEDIRASIAWSLGTGTSINPLDDNWIPPLGPLRPYLLHDQTTLQVQQISDLLDNHGQWDVMKLSGVWSRLLPPQHLVPFYYDDFRTWLASNVAITDIHPILGIPWHLLFVSTLWQIWKNRNAWVFNGIMSIDADIVQRSITWVRYYSECTFKAPSSHSPSRESKHWQRPELG
ncbi:hypothetical protein V6N11_080460 [Hibiscus sabdariffa]|uniref:CCHC-type domain-containing protein n=1 Tax=Hibiscus sabdariffa TaxID=183260 RepID=A0ABR2R7R4_9ROSI